MFIMFSFSSRRIRRAVTNLVRVQHWDGDCHQACSYPWRCVIAMGGCDPEGCVICDLSRHVVREKSPQTPVGV